MPKICSRSAETHALLTYSFEYCIILKVVESLIKLLVVVGCEVSISKSIEGKLTFTFGDGLVVRGDSLCVCVSFFRINQKQVKKLSLKIQMKV